MIEIKQLIKRNNIKVLNYRKSNNNIIISNSNNKYIIKRGIYNKKIMDYLNSRGFNYYPDIYDYNNKYQLIKYVEDSNIPKEKKINDLINIVALLHKKTSFYKEVDEVEYKKLYEDLLNNCSYLKEYYNDLISIIDSKVFMSPKEYLLASNITLIFDSISYCEVQINKWYEIINSKDKTRRMRVCVIHNDLKLKNFIKDDKDYLINWDKSKIDMPIFDLYKLYLRCNNDYDFIEILRNYEKSYPLLEDELLLLYILISMPSIIKFNRNNYDTCISINKEINKLLKTSNLIKNYKKSP